MVIAASLLSIFTNETMDSTFDELSKSWKLRIGNVAYNQSCVRVHITNIGNKEATLEKFTLTMVSERSE
jgi:hypothetical protein